MVKVATLYVPHAPLTGLRCRALRSVGVVRDETLGLRVINALIENYKMSYVKYSLTGSVKLDEEADGSDPHSALVTMLQFAPEPQDLSQALQCHFRRSRRDTLSFMFDLLILYKSPV